MKALFRKLTAAAGALLCVLGLAACARAEAALVTDPPSNSSAPSDGHNIPSPQQVAAGRELMCLAKDQEEAEAVAESYGIELVDFQHGVAVFHTEENPYDVIRRGKENGWTLLSINHVITLTD